MMMDDVVCLLHCFAFLSIATSIICFNYMNSMLTSTQSVPNTTVNNIHQLQLLPYFIAAVS